MSGQQENNNQTEGTPAAAAAAATEVVRVPPSEHKIPCMCSDGVVVEVPANHLRHSKLFDEMCKNLGIDDNGERRFEGEFAVPTVRSEIMVKVADWCAVHADQPDPVVEENELLERKWFTFTDYERNFLSVAIPELKELLMAALFLDIRTLLLYSAQHSASLMRDKTCPQVREEWDLEDDLTEEEKEALRAENAWIRE